MSHQQDIDVIKGRLVRAESERDAWRVAGVQEKYLQAYSMVEALELQLDEQLRRHLAEGPHDAGSRGSASSQG